MKLCIDPENLRSGEDWQGNNIAITCLVCKNVFIVSSLLHEDGRNCPVCDKCFGKVTGGAKSGGSAEYYIIE